MSGQSLRAYRANASQRDGDAACTCSGYGPGTLRPHTAMLLGRGARAVVESAGGSGCGSGERRRAAVGLAAGPGVGGGVPAPLGWIGWTAMWHSPAREASLARSVAGAKTMKETGIEQRKADHIDLAAHGDVGFTRTTLLECVRLVHDALPELHADRIDTSVRLLGKTLRAPLFIAGMTGGVERAASINRELATLAETRGYAFGLGSQRAMHQNPNTAFTYGIRDVAPHALVFGNLGLVQAGQMSTEQIRTLVTSIEADAFCVHLNPAMEIVQPGGDRDFTGGENTLRRLVSDLGIPVVVKETGCGLSRSVGTRLRALGVRHVDVSGAGGTSWVAVEMHRNEGGSQVLGQAFREWGIPTAASIGWMSELGFDAVMATGGIGSGLDVARAIALGADVAGIARPVLQALLSGGRPAAEALLDGIEAELRAAMFLTGSGTVSALKSAPRIVVGELEAWLVGGRAVR
jgi:isopentenyl-diphosphate Delta-isomerase